MNPRLRSRVAVRSSGRLRRRVGAAAALLACAGLVAGCTTATQQGTARPEGAVEVPRPAAPAGLERYYTQQVDWESCAGYGPDAAYIPAGVSCARITVPLDYDDPGARDITVAVSRAEGAGDRIGALLLNPGGPGVSGLAAVGYASDTEVGERFDLVGFDPRGVGASEPAVRCRTDRRMDEDRAVDDGDTSPEGIAATEQRNRDFAALCAEKVGPDVLAHIGTREVVRDMDVIRAVVTDPATGTGDTAPRDPRMNYVGFSYGTRLGTEYAETFPDRVRALVLDGAVDPRQTAAESVIDQGAGFQKAFDAFAADCARRSDCPLGSDPTQASARFREIVAPLRTTPARTTDPRGLSYGDAMTGVAQALYAQSFWGQLRAGLMALADDGTGDTLLLLADLYSGRADDGTYSNVDDAFVSIGCVDGPPITDPAEAGALDMRYREVAPFADDGRGTGRAALDSCAFWPVPPTGAPHTPSVDGLPTVLVVSTTGDPATPYQAGVDLARMLGARLLTHEGEGHTVVFDGDECVDSIVRDYLVDLTLPDGDVTC